MLRVYGRNSCGPRSRSCGSLHSLELRVDLDTRGGQARQAASIVGINNYSDRRLSVFSIDIPRLLYDYCTCTVYGTRNSSNSLCNMLHVLTLRPWPSQARGCVRTRYSVLLLDLVEVLLLIDLVEYLPVPPTVRPYGVRRALLTSTWVAEAVCGPGSCCRCQGANTLGCK